MKLLENYKPLFVNPPQKRYFLITGGRGSAKSYHASVLILNLTYEPDHVILFTRWTLTSAYISIIPEFLEKIEELNKQDDFEVTRNEIINKLTGSRIIFKGIKTSQGTATANLKSIVGVTTWVLDESEELVDEDIFDRIDLSIRSQKRPNRVIMIMNPAYRTHFIYKRFIESKPDNVTHIHTTYEDNKLNLSESFIESAERTRKVNPARFEHLFMGEWLDDAEGLLWSRQIIDNNRVKTKPQLERIIIAIDPAVTANEKSDETGIVVVGQDADKVCYILEDVSGKYSPNQWAEICKATADEWDIDYYVAEGNQGHDLVASNLRHTDSKRRVKVVRATRGKHVRAEPIYSLYEQGKVKHYGYHSKLESQMVSWNPDENIKSPDRVDALVWGVTELTNKDTQEFMVF